MGICILPQGGWRIHNYKVPEAILMGFEYEVEAYRDDKLTNELTSLLPKHYSYAYETLGAGVNGYEIKSSVAPLRTLKGEVAQIKSFFRHGPESAFHSNGGIHVNISKTPYTNAHYKKVFAFLHEPTHFRFLCKLSGRMEQRFRGNAAQIHPADDMRYRYYCGIITTRKSYAYEMRMFGAEEKLLVPALEFCHALFDLSSKEPVLTIDNVKKHIHRWRRYSHISQRIKDLEL